MSKPAGVFGQWGIPPRPFATGVQNWRGFLDTIDARIEHLRQSEGIDGRTEPWCTFDPPLPRRAPLDRAVRLRLMAASTAARDDHGRFIPAQERAS